MVVQSEYRYLSGAIQKVRESDSPIVSPNPKITTSIQQWTGLLYRRGALLNIGVLII